MAEQRLRPPSCRAASRGRAVGGEPPRGWRRRRRPAARRRGRPRAPRDRPRRGGPRSRAGRRRSGRTPGRCGRRRPCSGRGRSPRPRGRPRRPSSCGSGADSRRATRRAPERRWPVAGHHPGPEGRALGAGGDAGRHDRSPRPRAANGRARARRGPRAERRRAGLADAAQDLDLGRVLDEAHLVEQRVGIPDSRGGPDLAEGVAPRHAGIVESGVERGGVLAADARRIEEKRGFASSRRTRKAASSLRSTTWSRPSRLAEASPGSTRRSSRWPARAGQLRRQRRATFPSRRRRSRGRRRRRSKVP